MDDDSASDGAHGLPSVLSHLVAFHAACARLRRLEIEGRARRVGLRPQTGLDCHLAMFLREIHAAVASARRIPHHEAATRA